MYTLIRHCRTREALFEEAPSLILAMVVAELFYKLHSFTLEAIAFLATWYALSRVGARLSRSSGGR